MLCFWLKYESIIHNNAPSSEKVHLLLSLTPKSVHIFVSSYFGLSKRCLIRADFSPDSQMTFSLEEAIFCTQNSYLPTIGLFLLSSADVNWWTGVVWIIVMFWSSVWTLILTAPIHCRASIAEQVMESYISSNLKQQQTPLRWPETMFGWTIPLKE